MKDGKIVHLARWIEGNFWLICQQWGPVLLTLLSLWIGIWFPEVRAKYEKIPKNKQEVLFWVKMWTPWLFILCAGLTMIGGFLGVKQGKKIHDFEKLNSDLKRRLEDAEQSVSHFRNKLEKKIYESISDHLGSLSEGLEFNDSERISLYLHDAPRKRFILAGRFSKNPELTKINRTAFPENEGCISQAWINGGSYFVEIPINGEYNSNAFEERNISVNKRDFKKLRMKSVAYCLFSISEKYQRIGIIVFESTKLNTLCQSKLSNIFTTNEPYLVDALKNTRETNSLIAYQTKGKPYV